MSTGEKDAAVEVVLMMMIMMMMAIMIIDIIMKVIVIAIMMIAIMDTFEDISILIDRIISQMSKFIIEIL